MKKLSFGWMALLLGVCGCSKTEAPSPSESAVASGQTQGRTTIVGTRPSAGEQLAVGDEAPDFVGPDQRGESFSLASLRGKPVVVYFYPKDNTPGCTAQAQALRDDYPKLQAKGAAVIGISADSPASHTQFAADHQLPFTLVSDPDGRIAAKYGVPFNLVHSRQSFVVGADGKLKALFRKVNVSAHAAEVLAALE